MSQPPTEDVALLRARIAELEAALQDPGNRAAGNAGRGSRWKAVSATVLIVTACLLAPLSVTSVWASSILSDTDRYVETVAPIAEDPGVQTAIADAVTTAIIESLDVEALTSETLDALAANDNLPPRVADTLPALAVPLTRGIESFTYDQVAGLVASSQFQQLWEEVNQVAHTQVVSLLEGNEGGALSAQEDTITLNLAPIIEEVKQRLVDQGFGLAANIPAIDKSFVLVQSEGITQAQGFYVFLNNLGLWLPFIALALFAGGVLLAGDRRRALLRGALGVVFAMVALGVALALVRELYVETTPGNVLTSESAANVFDDLVVFLRSGLRALGVLFLLVALAAFLTGPSSAAVRTRAGLSGGIGSLRGGAENAGLRTGRFGAAVFAHKRGLRLATFLAGGATLLAWSRPTVGTVLGVALVVALLLALIEFLGRPPGPEATGPDVIPGQPSRREPVPAPRSADEDVVPPRPEREGAPHG